MIPNETILTSVYAPSSVFWNLGQFYSACYSLRGSQAVASAAPAKQRYYFSNQQKR